VSLSLCNQDNTNFRRVTLIIVFVVQLALVITHSENPPIIKKLTCSATYNSDQTNLSVTLNCSLTLSQVSNIFVVHAHSPSICSVPLGCKHTNTNAITSVFLMTIMNVSSTAVTTWSLGTEDAYGGLKGI
jgi:hypothetical protein